MSDATASPVPNGAAAPSQPAAATATVPTGLPPLYAALEPLVAERHRALRLKPKPGFAFAQGATAIPVAAEEFVAAARSMPLVFAAEAPHMPLAVTGLASGRNLFVEADGSWRLGAYIPAYLRRHPFMLVRAAPNSDQLVLCIDPNAPEFDQAEGEPLFTAEGQGTPATERALAFCRSMEEAGLRTRAMAQGLAELDLLKPAVLQFDLNGKPIRIDGFHAVDRAALQALPPEKLAELRDRGWLEAIYAHLLSLGGMQDLALR